MHVLYQTTLCKTWTVFSDLYTYSRKWNVEVKTNQTNTLEPYTRVKTIMENAIVSFVLCCDTIIIIIVKRTSFFRFSLLSTPWSIVTTRFRETTLYYTFKTSTPEKLRRVTLSVTWPWTDKPPVDASKLVSFLKRRVPSPPSRHLSIYIFFY